MFPTFSYNWFMYQVMPVVGIVMVLVFPIVAIVFWKKVLPKSARTLFWCKKRNMPPLLIVHDSGRAEITMISERRGGMVMTRSGKYKLLPRFPTRRDFSKTVVATPPVSVKAENLGVDGAENLGVVGENIVPKPMLDGNGEVLPVELQTLYEQYFPDYSGFISKRCQLRGLNLPFFLGYSGSACLVNPEALILYEAGQMAVQMNGIMNFNPNNIEGKELKNAYQPLMIYDARIIKTIISDSYDETQLAAITTDAELIGLIGRGIGRYLPVIYIIVIIVLAIVGITVIAPMIGG